MIFVVGHTGRVGGYLYHAYQRSGFQTIGIGRGHDYSVADLPLRNGPIDSSLNCIVYAALSSDRPYTPLQREGDLNALWHCIEWAGRLKARPRLVFFSSISVYENLKSGVTDTGIELSCDTPYAQMKLDSENLIKRFRKNFGSIDILRCGALLVDPTQDESFMGRLVTAVKEQQTLELVNPNNRFNALIMAADLFRLINSLLSLTPRKNPVATYNVGSTDPLTMGEIAEYTASRLGAVNSVKWRKDSTVGERVLRYPPSLSERLPTVRESLDKYTSQFQGLQKR